MKGNNGLEEDRGGRKTYEYRKNGAGINHKGDCLPSPPLLYFPFNISCLLRLFYILITTKPSAGSLQIVQCSYFSIYNTVKELRTLVSI